MLDYIYIYISPNITRFFPVAFPNVPLSSLPASFPVRDRLVLLLSRESEKRKYENGARSLCEHACRKERRSEKSEREVTIKKKEFGSRDEGKELFAS